MSNKGNRIAEGDGQFRKATLDPHYTGYFELFNRQKFFEAHEVLEHLWLPDKHGPNGAFYKGLIQLAGAFVHLQKNRPQPAASLFKLALANLEKYPVVHKELNLQNMPGLIHRWLTALERPDDGGLLLTEANAPKLKLERSGE